MLRLFATATLTGAVGLLTAAPSAAALPARNDYVNAAFTGPLSAGLRAFYARDFSAARRDFDTALIVIPDNTLALSMLDATAAQQPGELDALVDFDEGSLAKEPKSPLAHTRVALDYMFASLTGRDRLVDAREELNAAIVLDPSFAAAHTALGIMRENERSANRAKTELLAALATDPHNVLAREYLSLIYQNDLKDPQRGLTTIIDIPNVVPDYADVCFHIASLLHDLGQYDAAARYATRGLEADVGRVGESGQHGDTLLARIYLDEKKPDDARRVLRASIGAGADVAYATTLMAKIDAGAYGPLAATPVPSPTASPVPRKPQQ